MSATFSPSQVAAMTGVSLAGIRSYCDRFAAYFSSGATPPKGTAREFTAEDVRLVGFIRAKTTEGLSHAQVAQAIDAGEAAEFTQGQAYPAADVEDVDPSSPAPAQPSPTGGALVTAAQTQALQTLLEDYRRREETIQARAEQIQAAAQDRERALHDQIAALQRELGKAEGELAALKSRRPWWRAIFGGSAE